MATEAKPVRETTGRMRAFTDVFIKHPVLAVVVNLVIVLVGWRAKAAFFPQVSLTGFYGVESVALSDLFTGPSRIWQFGPTVTVPIFNAGRNRANLALTEAQQREALARYEQAIQQAFREVEDALIAHRKAREALAYQDTAVQASREALSIAEFRYSSGLTSYLNVLEAQRSLLGAEVAESRTLLSQLVAVVQLYRALGGGWDAQEGQP